MQLNETPHENFLRTPLQAGPKVCNCAETQYQQTICGVKSRSSALASFQQPIKIQQ